MSLLQPRHKMSSKNRYQTILLIFVGLIASGIVMCSFLFSAGYNIYLRGIENLETQLQGKIRFRDIVISPLGTILVRDIAFFQGTHTHSDNANNTDVVPFNTFLSNYDDEGQYLYPKFKLQSLEISVDPLMFMKYIFTPFEELSEYDRQVLSLKNSTHITSFDYLTTKSLRKVSIDGVQGRINLPDDEYLLLFVQELLFSKKILPHNMLLELSHVSAQVITPALTVTGQDLFIDSTLSDSTGIRTKYIGGVELQKLNQKLATEVHGIVETEDFFQHLLIESALVNTNFNHYATLSPLTVTVEKVVDTFDFNVDWDTADAHIQGKVIDDRLDIELNIAQVNMFDLFVVEDNSIFSNINDDMISGSGTFSRDARTHALRYELALKNSDTQNKRFDIMLRGDEKYMYIDEFFVDLNNQLIAINGDFSFQNFGMNGTMELLLSAPIVKNSISGSFNFVNFPSISMGTSDNFTINNEVQPQMAVEYSWDDKFVKVHLGNQQKPIVSIQQIANTSQYEVVLSTFPFKFLSSYYNLYSFNAFNEAIIDAQLVVDVYEDSIQSISYDIKGSNRQREYDYLYFNGVYDNNILTVDKGRVYAESYDITSELRGSVDFNQNILKKEFLNFSIDFYDGANVPATYSVTGNNNLENDILSFVVADNLAIDVLFSSGYNKDLSALKRVRVKSQDFVVPIIDYHITTDLDLAFSDLKIDEIIAKLKIATPQNNILQVAGTFGESQGTISEIMLQKDKRTFTGEGTINYLDTDVLQLKIIETIPIDENTRTAQKSGSHTLQSYDISYNYGNKQLYVNAENANLVIFTNRVSGIVSTDFIVDFENEVFQGQVSDSVVLFDINRFNVYGDFFLLGFDELADITVSNLHIIGNTHEVTAEKVLVKDFKKIESTFRVYAPNAPLEESSLYVGDLSIDAENTIFNIFDSTTPEFLSELNAHIRLEPLFTGSVLLKSKYTFDVFITSKDGYIYVVDKTRDIDLTINPAKQLVGTIGNPDSLVFAKVSGLVSREELKINADIISVDMGTLSKEFPNNSTIFTIDTMKLQGKLSIRGVATNPSLYGYVTAHTVEGYMGFFDKDIIMSNITILISNNDLSVVRSLIEVDKNHLYMNAKGRISVNGLEPLQIDFFTLENQYIDVKQLRIAKLSITGEVRGKISLLIDPDNMDVEGTIYLNNALFSNEKLTPRQTKQEKERVRARRESLFSIQANVRAVTESGVIFVWPTNGFSILKAGFARNQSVLISYDGEVKEFDVQGNLLFNSGTIYYLDKGFEISELKVVIDEFNGLTNPYVDYLEATTRERYDNETYNLNLIATSTFLDNMQVTITADPFLSPDELSMLLGQNILPTTADSTDSQSSVGVVSTIVKLSDPLSNIGIFSRLENLIQQSLRLDYLSFKTQIVQNLLEYTVQSSRSDYLSQQPSAISHTSFSLTNSSLLPYLFDKSSIVLGKYINIIYLNLAIELDTIVLIEQSTNTYQDGDIIVPLNLYFNVELPTPFFDVTWSIDPSLFDIQNKFVPMNLLTISWRKKF